jgi:hypothetical protein
MNHADRTLLEILEREPAGVLCSTVIAMHLHGAMNRLIRDGVLTTAAHPTIRRRRGHKPAKVVRFPGY